MSMRLPTSAGVVALFLALSGCSTDSAAEVSGTVTFDGKPVADGAISFRSPDGSTSTAGGIVKDGKYSAKVPRGTMKVEITGAKVVGQKKVYNTPNSPMMPITEEMLPSKYNVATTLTYEVKPGSQVKDFELTK